MYNKPTGIKSILSTFRTRGIGRRFAVYILLFSSVITLIITFIQLFYDYRKDVSVINAQLQEIQILYQETLSTAVWVHNASGLNLQLDGMMRLPTILYVQVDDELGKKIQYRGTYREKRTLKNSFELSHVHRGKSVFLGKMNVLADLDVVYNRLINKLVIIFISQGIKTFLVSLFILLLFHLLVGRSLLAMAKVSKKISAGAYKDRLDIGSDDELSDVSASFNNMTGKLVSNMETLEQEVNERRLAQHALEDHKSNLEKLVQKKTSNLTKANKELQATEEELKKFKTVSDKSLQGNAIVDPEGNIIYINNYFSKVHGYTADKLIGCNLSIFHNDNQIKAVNKINESLVKNGHYGPMEVWHVHKDGTEFPMLMNGIMIENNNGIPQYMAVTAIDITRQKYLENQLQQAQKMETIGTLAGGIAHDFNNILFPIVGHAEMLLEDIPKDSPLRSSSNEIFVSALRAKDLVKQILTFSRQEKGELKLMKLQPIVKEALKLIRSTIPTTIKINQDIRPDCGVIKADPTQIHQIVMNIATNAYHAMEDTGGELTVKLKEVEIREFGLINSEMTPGLFACLTIADKGIGMDKELRNKIFDPFFTTKEQGKGTGMGLSVVHGIVTSMNGGIQIFSEPGKGTEFRIYFPLEKTYREQGEETKQSIQGGTEHILLVDDEKSIISMERKMLERMGYKVTPYSNSVKALEAFRNDYDKFDVVISDLAMPNVAGEKLASEMLKIRPNIPIILNTGFSDKLNPEIAEKIGIKGILMKPIVKSELAQTLRKILDT